MERDADGFLLNTSDWSLEIMQEMAKNDGFQITDQIMTYILKAREMYHETGTVPAVRVFAKEFGMDRKAKELYEDGAIGDLVMLDMYNDRYSAEGAWQYPIPPDANPDTIDFDFFLGDAPKVPYDLKRFFSMEKLSRLWNRSSWRYVCTCIFKFKLYYKF